MSELRHTVSIAEMVDQLSAIGVARGAIVLVHSSYRALRPLEDGPFGVIAALREAIGDNGTLVMPSWTGDNDQPFDSRTTRPSADLGVIPGLFWQLPTVLRSDHPFAFAACGPRAERIVADPLVLPPHQSQSPVGRVVEMNGKILLLGVDHDANTTLHLAELLAGVPYRLPHHVTVRQDGRPVRLDYLENDHCCELFRGVNDWLDNDGAQSYGTVGHAASKIVCAKDLIDIVVPRLRDDPFALIHPRDSDCSECAAAWRSVEC